MHEKREFVHGEKKGHSVTETTPKVRKISDISFSPVLNNANPIVHSQRANTFLQFEPGQKVS